MTLRVLLVALRRTIPCTCDGIPAPPINVNATLSANKEYITITWEDGAASDEIGFRVDRKTGLAGTWKTISMRPPRRNGTAMNEQKWLDYMFPTGEDVYYRVAAMDCNNNNNYTSSVVGPINSKPVGVNPVSVPIEKASFVVAPNKINKNTQQISIIGNIPESSKVDISILNSNGIVLKTESKTLPTGYNEILFSLPIVHEGVYFILVQSAQQNEVLRLVVN